MNINERQATLLKNMLEETDYKTMKDYAEMLQVSYKTIANDVKVMDEYLKEYSIILDKKPHRGIRLRLDTMQMEELTRCLQSTSGSENYLSIKNRRDEIFLQYVWHSDSYFSIQKFSNEYYVSPSSIMKDLEIVSNRLKVYDITLDKSSKGTKIVGTEINIRKALADDMETFLYEHIADLDRYQQLNKRYQHVHHLDIEEIEEIISFLEQCMNTIETVSKKIINEPYYSNAFLYLVLMILRNKQGHSIKAKAELAYPTDAIDQVDFDFTLRLVDSIQKRYTISIQEVEAINIYRHLISGGLSKKEIAIVEKNTRANDLNSLTLAYTRYLIEHMSILFGIDFTNQVYLHSNLRFHIKPMLNRLRYDIKINNMMLKEIQERYPLEFYLTELSCIFTSRRYEIKEPSKAEVAYIMVYFQSAIERHLHHIQTILVSSNSVGSAQLLKTRLENAFQDLSIKEILSPAKLNQVNMEDIDLILSTGNVTMNLPYLSVSVFCEEADITKIRHYIKDMKKRKVMDMKDMHISMIEKEVEGNDQAIVLLTLAGPIVLQKSDVCRLYVSHCGDETKYGIYYSELKELHPLLQYVLTQR